MLTCSYFYDEEYLRGFQFLLQELEAALKHRRVAALEAFGLRRTRPADPFRGYLRELNLFNPEVLEGSGFRQVQVKGEVARYRLDLGHARRGAAPQRRLGSGRGGGRGAAGLRAGAAQPAATSSAPALAEEPRQALLPVLGQHRVERVVEGDDAQQPALRVDHRQGEQVVLGHDAADLFFVQRRP